MGEWINEHLADDPGMNIAILGDWNGFYWEEAQTQLTDAGLVNLQVALLPEEERYSYVFDGNAQLLDNILVTGFSAAPWSMVSASTPISAVRRPATTIRRSLRSFSARRLRTLLSNVSVDENLPASTVVRTVSAADAATDTLTYTLVDNAGGLFAIDAATGVIHDNGSPRP